METITQVLTIVGGVLAVIVITALLVIAVMFRQWSKIRVPPNADFFTTMRYVPLSLAICLDLLDLGLDVFSAPVTWILLDRIGLRGIRDQAAIEGLLPFTGPIPTLSLAWVATRLFNLGSGVVYDYDPDIAVSRRRTGPPQHYLDDVPYEIYDAEIDNREQRTASRR